MANFANQAQEINYISQRKKICVGRNNQPVEQLIHFDYRITDTFSFSVVNAINQIVNIGGKSYEIYGSFIDAKNELHVIFYTNNYSIQDNVLTFVVDTYTNQYLEQIKNDKEIDLTIVAHKGEGSQVVLRDRALASPRPYVEGREPLLIVYTKMLDSTIPISGQFGAGTDIDLVVGSPSFAFGEGLITNDTNQIVFGQYNAEDATKVLIVGGGTESQRANIFSISDDGNVDVAGALSTTALYINGQEVNLDIDSQLSATSAWVSGTFETAQDATGKFETLTGQINDLTTGQVAENTSGISALNNAISAKADKTDLETLSTTVDGLAETKADLSALQEYAKLSAIPTKTSDLTNDSGYITLEDVPSGTVYGAGFGLATSGEANNIFYLTGTVLSAGENLKIENNIISLTGDIGGTYTPGTGIAIEDNVISVSGDYASNSDLTAVSSIVSAILEAEVVTPQELSVVSSVITAQIPTSTSSLTNDSQFVTSAQVDEQISSAISSVPSTVYTGTDGIKVDNGVISLTATIPTGTAQLTNDANFLSSITVNYNDQYDELQTGSVTGITLTGSFINGSIQNNKLELEWAGIKCAQAYGAGYFTEIDSQTLDFSSDSEHLHIEIPSYYNELVSGAAVDAATGWVSAQNYISSITLSAYNASTMQMEGAAITAINLPSSDFVTWNGQIFINEDKFAQASAVPNDSKISGIATNVLTASSGAIVSVATGAIPTGVSQLTNDSGFITGITVSYNDEEWNEYTVSGTGISFTNDVYFEASEYNNIITISWKGVRTCGGSESIDIYSKRYDWSSDFRIEDDEGDAYISLATPIPSAVTDLSDAANYALTSTLSTVSGALNTAITNVSGAIPSTVSQLVNDSGYITSNDVPEYTGVSGIGVNNQTHQIAITGGVKYIAGNRIRFTDTAQGTRIDWLEYVITASPLTADFDWRLAPQTSSIVYNYEGTSPVTVSFNPALPNGISGYIDSATSSLVFTTTSGATVQNGTNVVSATIIADDAVEAIVETKFNCIGKVIGEFTGSNQTMEMNFAQETSYTSAFTFGYTGNESESINVSFINLPEGIAVTSSYSENAVTITLSASEGDIQTNGTFNATLFLTSNDTNNTSFSFTLVISGIEVKVPLTFRGLDATNAVSLQQISNAGAPTGSMQYCKNNDFDNWIAYNRGDVITFNQNETVSFSGNITKMSDGAGSYSSYNAFRITGTVEAEGSVDSLNEYAPTGGIWPALFRGCSGLIKAPDLPATSVPDFAYSRMFAECPDLRTPPTIIPVSTIPYNACSWMFQYCPSLTAAPALPATKVGHAACFGMFEGCTSLSIAPAIYGTPQTNSVAMCYREMFQGCTALTSIEVHFTNWYASQTFTENWVNGVNGSGTFYHPAGLTDLAKNASKVPTNFTTQAIS